MLRCYSASRLCIARFQLPKYSPRETSRLKCTEPPDSATNLARKSTNTWTDSPAKSSNTWTDTSANSTVKWTDHSRKSANTWTDSPAKSTNKWTDSAAKSTNTWTDRSAKSTEKWTDHSRKSAKTWTDRPARSTNTWTSHSEKSTNEWTSHSEKSTNTWINQSAKSTNKWTDPDPDPVTKCHSQWNNDGLSYEDSPFDEHVPQVAKKSYHAINVRTIFTLEIEELRPYWDEQIKMMEEAMANATYLPIISIIQSNMISWPYYLLKFLESYSFLPKHKTKRRIEEKDMKELHQIEEKDLPASKEKRISIARELMSFMREHTLYSQYVDHHLVQTEFAKVLLLLPSNEAEVRRIVNDVESSYPFVYYDWDTSANLVEIYTQLGDLQAAEAIYEEAKLHRKFKNELNPTPQIQNTKGINQQSESPRRRDTSRAHQRYRRH